MIAYPAAKMLSAAKVLLTPDQTIQDPGRWLSVVRFLNSKIGFAFSRDDEVEAVVEPRAIGVACGRTGRADRLKTTTLHR